MRKAVLDIGKTHIKLLFLENNSELASFSCKNSPVIGMYSQCDVNAIWSWLTETLRSCNLTASVEAFSITTHGAAGALINHTDKSNPTGLVLPILDYEYEGVDNCEVDYCTIRPSFNETYSPSLPCGLNLGKQLFWLESHYPDAFSSATAMLMYPQYWAWRLCGELATEVTSLGCHTDLWEPVSVQYSTLVEKQSWHRLFPPLKNAWDCLGTVTDEVSEETGLSISCKVYTGVHDSNASLLRYLKLNHNKAFSVISTGTWTILMQVNGNLEGLGNYKDTLSNVDVYGNPVACARFMGGREYERICASLGGNIVMSPTQQDLQTAIDNLWMVTPDYSNGNGPFGGLSPRQYCPENSSSVHAIATLYCALMIDRRLDDLDARGEIFIEGAFLKNQLLCALVAQLRPHQKVWLSADNTGTVLGASALMEFEHYDGSDIAVEPCSPSSFDGIEKYRAQWLFRINQSN
jgi:sugar (pentulose or hexulose) kinase